MMTTTARAGALLAAAALIGLLALAGWSPAQAAGHTVTMQGYAYSQASLSVDPGDTVTWVNKDQAPHDVVVTSGPQTFRSPLLNQGESWSFTFRSAGTYSYICSVHPDMRASVTVKAAPKPPPAPAPAPAAPAEKHDHPQSKTTAAPTPAAGAQPQAAGPKQAPTTPAQQTPAPAPAPAAAAAPAAQVAPAPSETSLNPLLLVAGAAIAVVVFCLLMLASRPSAD